MQITTELLNEIKNRIDLRDIVTHDLGEGKDSGQSRRWACPFHQGSNPTAFSVTKSYFYCWSCEASGDIFTWTMKRTNLDFKEAVKTAMADAGLIVESLSITAYTPSPPPLRSVAPTLNAPSTEWQASKHHYVKRCEAYLWSQENQAALDYLRGRGFRDETIEQAHLGYDPGRQVIVIPWYINEALWRISAKSLTAGGRKAPIFAGFRPGLYNADQIDEGKKILLCEGEFDALTVNQEAGDLVTAVATGGVTAGRQARWVAQLSQLSVLVAFDNDPSGERMADWWLNVLPDAQRWRPIAAKDPNDMLVKAGMNLRQWLGELPEAEAETDTGEETPRWRRWLKKK